MAAFAVDPAENRVARALAQSSAVVVDAAHTRLGGERHEVRADGSEVVLAQPVALLGQHDDRAPLGRLVGQRRHLRRLGEIARVDAGHRDQLGGLAVAQRDRAGLVEQQHVDVAGRLDGASGEGEHVSAYQSIHAGDADCAQQRADGRRDQCDEQRDQRRDGDGCARVGGVRTQRGDNDEEDQRQAREQDAERDLVRCLAARGALDEHDHAVEEALSRLLGDLDDDPVREHARTASDCRAVAAGLADHGGGLAGDR